MRVLITGITGFAGSHLADYLLAEHPDVEIFGTWRWRSRTENIEHLEGQIQLVECDLKDATAVRQTLGEIQPERIFHLAAQSFVPASWHAPAETLNNNIISQTNIFEAMRSLDLDARIQIAGSSEEYGLVLPDEVPITESNPLRPLSPYAVSKVAQDLLAYQYFRSYGLEAVRTRGFNHTGPRRGEVFVTSNFAKQIASIEAGLREPVIRVGNLSAQEDFTDVRDIVRAYWLALEKGKPGEVYNLCSGHAVTIAELLDMLLAHTDTEVEIKVDPDRLRPSDVEILLGDSSKFQGDTGWQPEIPLSRTVEDLLDYWRQRLGRTVETSRHLNTMKVLITGVAGFIGRRLAGYLRDQGHQVAGTYIETPPKLEGIELFEVDLLAEDRLQETVQRAAPEAVIHLAGLSHVGASWSRPADYFRVNVLGTERLLRCTKGLRFLTASSAEIYGAVPEDQQPIQETRIPAPQSPYALTKAAMERLVLAAGGVVVRAFNIIGPGQARTFALPTFARQLAAMSVGQQEPVLRVGNLTARRDLIHLDDAVGAYEVILHQGGPGECYNLGSGRAYRIQEVLDRLIAISGLAPEIRVDPSKVRPVDLPLLQADNNRLCQMGWQQQLDLDQALQDLWDATRSQIEGEAGSEGVLSA